jgi:hypothetical protein
MIMLLAGQVQTAAADQPTRQPLPFDPFTISGVCDFEVAVDILANKEIVTTFTDQEGNLTQQLITGVLKFRLTNLSTGESLDLNISGPARSVFAADGSFTVFGEGRALWPVPEGISSNVPAGLILTSGYYVAEFDAAGNMTEFTVVGGQVVEVCAALAG